MEEIIKSKIAIQAELSSDLINLFENFKKEPINRRTKVFLNIKQRRVEELFEKFSKNHDEISTSIAPADRKTHYYLKTSLYSGTEDTYWNMLTKIEEWREELTSQDTTQHVNLEQTLPTINNGTTSRNSEVRLPRINILPFSGDYRKWMSFMNMFTTLIHSKENMPAVEKFFYLRSHVTGEASKLIAHFTISDENYSTAWTTLNDRYGNTRKLVHSEIKALSDIPLMTSESASEIKTILDTTKECLNALANLKIDTATWDPIVIYILQQKLSAETMYNWENSLSKPKEVPTIKQFTDFLETRFHIVENMPVTKHPTSFNNFKPSSYQVQPKIKHNNYNQDKSFQNRSNNFNKSYQRNQATNHRSCYAASLSKSNSTSATAKCLICKGEHAFYKCNEFISANANTRMQITNRYQQCINCLQNHNHNECGSPRTCKKCNKRHHTMLHIDQPGDRDNYEASTSQAAYSQSTSSHVANNFPTLPQVLLATALVNVSHHGNTHTLRCLIDQGSQSSFITESAVQSLKLKRTAIIAHVTGLTATKTETSKNIVTFDINSIYNTNFNLRVEALVLTKITNVLPSPAVSKTKWRHTEDLQLADPKYMIPNQIDVLLGADVYGEIILSGLRKGIANEPIAQNTHLGWVLTGPATNKANTNIKITSMHHRIDIDNQLRKFWEQEEIQSTEKTWTEEEIESEQIYKDSYRRDSSGRYIVALPFRNKVNRIPLGKSKYRALTRLTQLEKKLARNVDLKQQYTDTLKEYQQLQHMVPAKKIEDETSELYYMPHHAVIKESSKTTKLRVVFDASAKTTSNKSLNEQLIVGPTIQQELVTILLRWRRYKIALSADITKMYRQIKVREEDWEFQRILWREEPHQRVQEFNLTTVTFGNAAAPFLAIRTLHQLADDESTEFPIAAEITKRDFYVDDLLTGADSESDAENLQYSITNMLRKGGMEIRSWISNSQKVLQGIPEDEREISLPLSIDVDQTTKTLGIYYHPQNDMFKFIINLGDSNTNPTKRSLLSETARLFDPLGWLGPVTIKAKIFFQQLWKQKLSWDQKLGKELCEQWFKFRSELKFLEEIHIPRWFKFSNNIKSIQLHGFSDASESAYAAVVFVRVQSKDDTVQVTMLTSKTRVAPIKLLTIPRLELCAAVLLANLLDKTRQALEIDKMEVFAWTDSKIVLAWLKGEPSKWKSFVAHRITEIHNFKQLNKWKYISTINNPADCASRGIYPSQLQFHRLWWEGPEFLHKSGFTWKEDDDQYETVIEGRNPTIITLVQVNDNESLSIIEKYSSLIKLIRIIATCRRFANNCKAKTKQIGSLTVAELKIAENICIVITQTNEFAAEIKALKNKVAIDRKSKLITFAPFIDDAGVIRIGGRLQNANIKYDQKHPVILPSSSHFSRLCINEAHIRCEHGGIQATVTLLRQRFWIIQTRNAVRRQINRCYACVRFKHTANDQVMGPLPRQRLLEVRPFTNVGVDYAGPLQIKASTLRSTKTTKGYICLFICLSVKAVHIEAVTDLTTQAFLAAFNRFVARRGLPSNVYSDNGSNFIGASREIQKVIQSTLNDSTINDTLANKGIQWHFIPPRAPHFGGLWEAGIKSIKMHLNRIMGDTRLTFEELSTVLSQIEACLNSRPLQPFNEDVNDFTALTPGHFLVGSELLSPPSHNFLDININQLRKWKNIQKMYQQFWDRWSKEYLNNLQQRFKWQQSKENSMKGDMVLLKEDNIPPTKWKLCRIEEVHPGTDGHTRVVTLRTSSGLMKRPITKLCLLPMQQ